MHSWLQSPLMIVSFMALFSSVSIAKTCANPSVGHVQGSPGLGTDEISEACEKTLLSRKTMHDFQAETGGELYKAVKVKVEEMVEEGSQKKSRREAS
mmetsp:Transcript_134499/g.268440  ORF Transcript_134499/g.268440 Transcript_134499/m.268440 type:complete len:97 (-) Transcript_134499:128-418(-)